MMGAVAIGATVLNDVKLATVVAILMAMFSGAYPRPS
jgi:mannose/fructose/N-acetylgalactosamine-specific phosphotransferase system component IIC